MNLYQFDLRYDAFSNPMGAYSFVEFVEVMSVLSFHSKRQEDFIQRTGNLLAFLSHAIKGHERRNQTNVDGKNTIKIELPFIVFQRNERAKRSALKYLCGLGCDSCCFVSCPFFLIL